MQIQLNGKPEMTSARTLAELVEAKQLDPSGLVVEHNGIIVKQAQWDGIELQAADTIELLSFVGGG